MFFVWTVALPRIFLSFFCYIKGWNGRLRVRSAFDLFLTLSWLCVTWSMSLEPLSDPSCLVSQRNCAEQQITALVWAESPSGLCYPHGTMGVSFPNSLVSWPHFKCPWDQWDESPANSISNFYIFLIESYFIKTCWIFFPRLEMRQENFPGIFFQRS